MVPMYVLCLLGYIVVIYNAWNLCNNNPLESFYTSRLPAPPCLSCHTDFRLVVVT